MQGETVKNVYREVYDVCTHFFQFAQAIYISLYCVNICLSMPVTSDGFTNHNTG